MRQYRINGQFLDNFDNDSFAISKAVSKIGEINLRHGDRSTGFKVKWTSKNIEILNYITILNSANNSDSFKKILGQIVEDDVVISDGYFQVIKFNPYKKDIDLRFYGGNTDWFSELKDKKINESDNPNDGSYNIDDLVNLTFSAQNISDNLINNEVSTSNPYKFFLVDNNKDSKRNSQNSTALNTFVDDYQIGFSQGVIFDRVFDSIGIKTKGNMFNDPKYYSTLISNSVSLKEPFSDEFQYLAEQSNSLNQSLPVIGNPTEPLTFDLGSPISEWDGQKITLQSTASGLFLSCNLQCITQNDNATNRDLLIEVYKNDTLLLYTNTIQETGTPFSFGQGSTTVSTFYTYNFDTGSSLSNIPSGLVEGDEINIRFASEFAPSRSNWRTTDNVFDNNAFLFFELDNYIKKEKANEYLPGINQDAFVKDVLAQFGAVTQYDANTRTLTCNKFDIVDNNRLYAPDWSKKIDLSKPPQIDLTKLLAKYGKSSIFKYQENSDSDFLNRLFSSKTNYILGTGVLKIDNDFLEDEKDFYESPYSPTINHATFPSADPSSENYQLGNFYLPFVPTYKFTGVDGAFIRQYEENDLNPRKYLFLGNVNIINSQKGSANKIIVNDGVSSIDVLDIPLVYFDKDDYPFNDSSTLNEYNESLSFSPLSDLTVNTFGYGDSIKSKITILEENYAFQKKILDKPVYLEIYLKLSPLDVQNVDFFTPIFLDFDLDSGYYYIDEISQYKGQDQSTKVKLVKI